jgi:hypothetical protein
VIAKLGKHGPLRAWGTWLLYAEGSILPAPVRDYLVRAVGVGYLPNYWRPRTFHEKLVTLVTTMPDPRRSLLADKLRAKRYVAATAPWVKSATVFTEAADVHDLDLASLPEVVVFKSNNSSGQVRVLRAPYDPAEIADLARTWSEAKLPGWKRRLEYHYDAIERRFYFEEFLGPDPDRQTTTYGFHVFHGRVVYLQYIVRSNDGTPDYLTFMDPSWSVLPIWRYSLLTREFFVNPEREPPPKPALADAMLRAAQTLLPSMPYVRVDLYAERDHVYLAEFTFIPSASITRLRYDWDLRIGAHLDLERARREIAEHRPIIL